MDLERLVRELSYLTIKPENGVCKHYEEFYNTYNMYLQYNIIFNEVLKDLKDSLPVLKIDFFENAFIKSQLLKGMHIGSLIDDCIINDDKDFRDKYFGGKYEELIDHVTNSQQFLIIFTLFENSIKQYMMSKNKYKKIKSKTLLQILTIIFNNYKKYKSLQKYTQDIYEKIWNKFIQIRNIYAHSYGKIDQKFINKMESLGYSINFNDGDYYIISDDEIAYFRCLAKDTWEAIYSYEYQKITGKDLEVKYQEKEVEKSSEKYALQIPNELPILYRPTLTSGLNSFKIMNYICPECMNKNDKYNLYYKISDNGKLYMTCPECMRIYIATINCKMDFAVSEPGFESKSEILNLDSDTFFDVLKFNDIKSYYNQLKNYSSELSLQNK